MSALEAERRWQELANLPMRPSSRQANFASATMSSIKDLWSHRELVFLLTRREIRARYKDSSLGLLWSLVRPLAQLLIYYFAIGKVLQVERSIPDFAIFVFVGLTAWTLYTEIVQKGATSIVHNAGLVKKVYLPREVFPLAGVGSALFSFVIQLIILAGAILVFGGIPSLSGLGYALLGLALLLILGVAFGLLLAALNVYLRDVEHLVEVAFVVLFWASPIVYSFNFVHNEFDGGLIAQLYAYNPVTLAILAMQRGLWAPGVEPGTGIWPEHHLVALVIAIALSVLFLWLAEYVFAKLQGDFAQEV